MVKRALAGLGPEFGPTLRLATPLVLAELGWMAMSIVDTMMVGRLPDSARAMGAVSLGANLFYATAIFGSGLLMGLDTLVSQAYGAGRRADCHNWLRDGLLLCLPMGLLLMGAQWLVAANLARFGVNPDILPDAVRYLRALIWSTLPLFVYTALRRYLQSMSVVAPVTFALVSANLVNAAANRVLIFGYAGVPALGAEGAGWATCLSRVYMALVLGAAVIYYDRRRQSGLWRTRLAVEWARLRRLAALGLPAALQFSFEVAVFAATTTLIARLDPASLAGHQVALNMASLTYMAPLGISSAAAVRVGQALGRRDPHGASRAGWASMALGAAFMSCAAAAFLSIPRPLARLFTPDPNVVAMGAALLQVAAFFQLFDGLQTVATGALRGLGDTRTPMLAHMGLYWLLGLPLGYQLCFRWGWGAAGLWVGLSLALILIGIVLAWAWRHRAAEAVRDFRTLPATPPPSGP